ncbi:MAG: response regulator [Thiolinea sp.]
MLLANRLASIGELQEPGEEMQNHSASKPRVLFVDDEERILKSMRALFRRKYQVTITTDGYQAIELLGEQHFHLLVTDQRMPSMSGVDLLRSAKNVSPDTVRILLTGYADLAAIIGSVNDGEVYRFLNKPWDNEEFIATIQEAVSVGQRLEADTNKKLSAARVKKIDAQPLVEPLITTNPANDEAIPEVVRKTQFRGHVMLLNGDAALSRIVSDKLPENQLLRVESYDAALDLMLAHEVGVVICSISGDYQKALAFFSLLKQEYPQLVSIILADSADSTAIVNLINQARVYRYMFKPLKTRLLLRYLDTALEQYGSYQANPALLQQQQVEKIKPSAAARFGSSHPVALTIGRERNDAVNIDSWRKKINKMKWFFRRFILK